MVVYHVFLCEKIMRKKILIFSPPFSGHLNVLKDLIRLCEGIYQIKLVITGWQGIQADLNGVEVPVEELGITPLRETDPALWTFPRVVELAGKCLAIARDFKPDLIIYDFFSLEGVLVGKILNITYWCSIPALIGPFTHQDYCREKLENPIVSEALSVLRNRYGDIFEREKIEMISDGLHVAGDKNIVWSYPSLVPVNFMINRADKTYRFVGNLRGKRLAQRRQLPERPKIYLSLGTVVMGNIWNQQSEIRSKLVSFFKALVEQWGDAWDVTFVTQGQAVLDKYPASWDVVERADQMAALSEASAFVTHGGANSFHEAVLQRVPMVAVPFFGDQPLVAEQIERLGIGLDVVKDSGIDTRKSKDFLGPDLAFQVDHAVRQILTHYEEYQRTFERLELQAENILELFAREI